MTNRRRLNAGLVAVAVALAVALALAGGSVLPAWSTEMTLPATHQPSKASTPAKKQAWRHFIRIASAAPSPRPVELRGAVLPIILGVAY